jgi:hypothetical protein
VVALLGAGGMAEVYRAKDTRLGREVAVKVVSEALGTDEAFLERFQREAKLASSVNHPNVLALYDVGLHDGKPYFVTELLQGETLRERLAKGPVQPLLDTARRSAEAVSNGPSARAGVQAKEAGEGKASDGLGSRPGAPRGGGGGSREALGSPVLGPERLWHHDNLGV